MCNFSYAYGKEMSALESMIASNPSGEAPIHPALSYELPAPNTSVVDRKQHVRAYPSSASSLSLTGTKTVRIRLGGEDFIDPSSIRLQFTIKNDEASKAMRPTTGPWGCWGIVRLSSNGVELDYIHSYGRFHTQYGFNQLSLEQQFGEVAVTGLHTTKQTNLRPELGTIPGGASLTVMHKLHLSLWSAGKLLPVKYAPQELELTLIDAADWLSATDGTTSFSQAFTLSDVQLLYDSYTLDEAVLQSFYSALLRNKVMSIGTMNAYQMVHPLPSGSTTYSFSSVRAFSRLSQIWLTFRASGPRSSSFICPGDLPGNATITDLDLINKTVPQVRLSIGPHQWPDPQPTSGQSSGELYMMMTKALGYQPNITRYAFEHDCFTIVFDIKKLPSDVTTALSTRSGDLVRVELTNLGTGASGAATECWMTMISFGVVAIRESGVTLLT